MLDQLGRCCRLAQTGSARPNRERSHYTEEQSNWKKPTQNRQFPQAASTAGAKYRREYSQRLPPKNHTFGNSNGSAVVPVTLRSSAGCPRSCFFDWVVAGNTNTPALPSVNLNNAPNLGEGPRGRERLKTTDYVPFSVSVSVSLVYLGFAVLKVPLGSGSRRHPRTALGY